MEGERDDGKTRDMRGVERDLKGGCLDCFHGVWTGSWGHWERYM